MSKKDLKYYLGLPYTITLKRGIGDGEEYWVARLVELPYCMTTGATQEEALRDIEDAKKEWIQSNLEDGLPVPEPTKYTGQYHLRMPPSLHEALTLKSESEDVSLNQYIVMALARAVGYDEPKKRKSKTTGHELTVVRESKRR
jgi:antitoxin HicB